MEYFLHLRQRKNCLRNEVGFLIWGSGQDICQVEVSGKNKVIDNLASFIYHFTLHKNECF